MNYLSPKRADHRILREASWLAVKRDPGSSFSFRHIRTRTFPFPFRYHPEMELSADSPFLQWVGWRCFGGRWCEHVAGRLVSEVGNLQLLLWILVLRVNIGGK